MFLVGIGGLVMFVFDVVMCCLVSVLYFMVVGIGGVGEMVNDGVVVNWEVFYVFGEVLVFMGCNFRV